MEWWSNIKARFTRQPPVIHVQDLDQAPARWTTWDGEKFAGGWRLTKLLQTDYWTLRARSVQLFETNPYARGIVRRLVINEINTGLHLEATPAESILGYPEDGLAEWSESTENLFELWGRNPRLCDHAERQTFGALTAQARLESVVSGDVLCVLIQDKRTKLPRVQLVNGACVQTPLSQEGKGEGNVIRHGVELDAEGRHVAFWIRKEDANSITPTFQRLPAVGPKSGRRQAWILYGTDKRLDDVRGKPLLALVLQSLAEIDEYRESTQRKAALISKLAIYIAKGEDKPGSRPLSGGAQRRVVATATDVTGTKRSFKTADLGAGTVIDELQHGETPHAFQSQGAVDDYADFEAAIVQNFAWSNNIPPEILQLSFKNNYSASKAAINEFKIYLDVARQSFADDFSQPVYNEWLFCSVLNGTIDAPGFLDSSRDPARYDVWAAWCLADWTGHIKPEVDLVKQADGYAKLVAEGFITRGRAARELTGTKVSKNLQQLARENADLAAANKPLADLERAPAAPKPGGDGGGDAPSEPEPDDPDAIRVEIEEEPAEPTVN